MNYEINISKNGNHFFATNERSLTHVDKASEVLEVLKTKFPKSEGYAITITATRSVGYGLNINSPIEEQVNNIYKLVKSKLL